MRVRLEGPSKPDDEWVVEVVEKWASSKNRIFAKK
jgi:hypothetical protein